jgi:hypothetical protein
MTCGAPQRLALVIINNYAEIKWQNLMNFKAAI